MEPVSCTDELRRREDLAEQSCRHIFLRDCGIWTIYGKGRFYGPDLYCACLLDYELRLCEGKCKSYEKR